MLILLHVRYYIDTTLGTCIYQSLTQIDHLNTNKDE